jgi:FkbM family methyltransferase
MEFEHLEVTPVKRAKVMRLLHRALPLERRLVPMLRDYEVHPGLLSVPWSGFRLHFPSCWLGEVSSAVYKGPRNNNPEFFELLAPMLPRLAPGRVVDVGAAIGVYILNFRALTNAPIIAYEPNPLAFELASYNVRSNRLSQVELRNVACGNLQGAIGLRAGINSFIESVDTNANEGAPAEKYFLEELCRRYSPGDQSVSVPLVRLDEDLASAGAISLLKIDCEGFEYQILSGSKEMIQRHRPVIFIELHSQEIGNYGHSIAEVCQVLRPNYHLEFWVYGQKESSRNPAVRFFGRYSNRGHRFPNEAAMLEVATGPSKPSQLFLLGRPK